MTATAMLQTVTDTFIEQENEWGAHNYHPLDLVIAEARGAWVTDVEGNRYLDCLSAYSAVNQGHCHPRLLATFTEQASRVTLTSRAFRNEQLGAFCEELATLCGMEMVLPMNTGAEAVEREFFTLFIGVGRGEILPYASYYLTGFLHERPLADLRGDLRQLGIAKAEGVSEPEDHLAFLAETYAGLLAGAFGPGPDAALPFFARHIRPWAARCFTDLEAASGAEFYRAVGRLGRLAVEIEAAAADLPA
jgi:TorA maturation chaperone TorD